MVMLATGVEDLLMSQRSGQLGTALSGQRNTIDDQQQMDEDSFTSKILVADVGKAGTVEATSSSIVQRLFCIHC